MSNRMGRSVAWAIVLIGSIAPRAIAGTDFGRFPLTKALPNDVFIAVASKENPEQQFLRDYWGEVHQAFMQSGILEDVWELMTDQMGDERADQIENLRDRFGELFGKVDWGNLFTQEMIYAARFSPTLVTNGSPYEGVFLGRMVKDGAETNYASFKSLLEEFRKMIQESAGEDVEIVCNESKLDGATITRFGIGPMPEIVTVGYTKDVFILGLFNKTILQDSLALLKGSSKTKGLLDDSRFQAAMAKLPAAEDSFYFFDIDNMMGRIKGMFEGIIRMREQSVKDAVEFKNQAERDSIDPAQAQIADDVGDKMRLIIDLIDDLSFADYEAGVGHTDGLRVYSESICALRPDATSKPLTAVFIGGKPSEDYCRFIPKEATNFGYSTGWNWSKLHEHVIKVMKKVGPEGVDAVAEYERMQEKDWKLNIRKDVLDLFEGSGVAATVGGDWFMMLKVTNEKKAQSRVEDLLKRLNRFIKSAAGDENGLMIAPVEIDGAEGFVQISHPMMMMMPGFPPPVIGCAEGHVIVGSSPKAVRLCLQTASGKHPNILKNKRFEKEGLRPDSGPVDSISFTDERNFGDELQATIGGLSMAMGMLGMTMQEAPPEARRMLSSITPILAKLGPVLGKLDFYQSSASYSTFDGRTWRTREVQNYKKPHAKKSKKGADEAHDASHRDDQDQDDDDAPSGHGAPAPAGASAG